MELQKIKLNELKENDILVYELDLFANTKDYETFKVVKVTDKQIHIVQVDKDNADKIATTIYGETAKIHKLNKAKQQEHAVYIKDYILKQLLYKLV